MATQTTNERLAGTWKFSPVHSSAEFSVRYLVANFRGRFEDFDATLQDGRLEGRVRTSSVNVRDENLLGHLLAPDFFDAERFPEITFASEELSIDGDDVTLDGQLTIKDAAHRLSAKGEVRGPAVGAFGETRLGFTLQTTIDRTAFGIDWNADLPAGGKALSNDVVLTVELEFTKA